MATKKSLMVVAALASVGLASVMALSTASAATDSKTTLVDRIATKFNLNKDDVQKVFDEQKAEHQAEHKAKLEEKLSAAVTSGELTEDQKSKILAKLDEMASKRQELKAQLESKTPEERRDLMEDQRDELEDWADENNIPTKYLHFGGHKMGGPRGGHR
jgi:hypothetical protein